MRPLPLVLIFGITIPLSIFGQSHKTHYLDVQQKQQLIAHSEASLDYEDFKRASLLNHETEPPGRMLAESGNPPDWNWIRQFGGSGRSDGKDIITDQNGNIIVAGDFTDSLFIGEETFISTGKTDGFIAKFDPDGNLVWFTPLESSEAGNVNLASLDIGPDNEIYACGSFTGDYVKAGTITEEIKGDQDRFFTRLNENGEFEWLQGYGNPGQAWNYTRIIYAGNDALYTVVHDLQSTTFQGMVASYSPETGDYIWHQHVANYVWDIEWTNDQLLIAGKLEESATFGDSSFTYTGQPAFFIAQLSSANKFTGATFYLNPDGEPGFAMLDAYNNTDIYLAGWYSGSLFSGGTELTSSTLQQAFLMKLNSDLSLNWTKFPVEEDNKLLALNTDNNGELFIYGWCGTEDFTFGGTPGTAIGHNFVLKVKQDGSVPYISGSPFVRAIEAVDEDNFFVTANESNEIAVNKYALQGSDNIFADLVWNAPITSYNGTAAVWYMLDVDKQGNIYAQGFYYNRISIMGRVLDGEGIFIVKFDDAGNMKWLKTIDATDFSTSGIKVDDYGNVFIWGTFAMYLKIEDLHFNNKGGTGRDVYLIRFDQDGDIKFVKQFEGTGRTVGSGGIDTDRDGNSVLAIWFKDIIKLGNFEFQSYDENYDFVITKIDPEGNVMWAKHFGGEGDDMGRTVAVDKENNVYVGGAFHKSVDFGVDVLSRNPDSFWDMFLLKLNEIGHPLWVRQGNVDNIAVRIHALELDNGGDYIYALGVVYDSDVLTILGDPTPVPTPNGTFVAKFAQDGDHSWTRIFAGTDYIWPSYQIGVDGKDNVYIGGSFIGSLTLPDEQVLEGSGFREFFIAKLNPDGNTEWVKTADNLGAEVLDIFGLDVYEEDVVIVGGRTYHGMFMEDGTAVSSNGKKGFIGLLGESIQTCDIELKIEKVNADPGKENGSASVTVSGGTPPYEIYWTNGDFGETADSLGAGEYMVYVYDSRGCEEFRVVTINNVDAPVIALNSITDASCYNSEDGAIDVQVTGGTPPYTYAWSNGKTTQDIDNLPPAPYELIVTDAEGRTSMEEFEVRRPEKTEISHTFTEPACNGGSDGSISLFVFGGTKPYSYSWSTGATTDSIYGLTAGTYEVTITDANSCTSTRKINLSEKESPMVFLEGINEISCGDADGFINITAEGGTGNINYSWSNGSTTQDISGLTSGEYTVTVTDDANCSSIHTFFIEEEIPAKNPICVITVDSVTKTNLVVWEKASPDLYYNIYRETSAKDVYLLAGTVMGDQLSEFNDTVADPRVRAFRYKISAIDECGNESELSSLHKTIHLRTNVGLGGTINLTWDDYKGIEYDNFEIYRYSDAGGWEELARISSADHSYTDLNPPLKGAMYVVRVPLPEGCDPSIGTKKSGGPYSYTLSNVEDNRAAATGVIKENPIEQKIGLYPNPAGSYVYIKYSGTAGPAEIILTGIQGRTFLQKEWENQPDGRMKISLAGYKAGLYFVRIRTAEGMTVGKLMVE